jgi:uncharacterized protein YndB with AHSA1/START domain
VEREIVVRVPVEVVWQALTDPTELCRWFPLRAEVTPGPGGRIRMQWADGEEMSGPIERWEPGRHLRLSTESAAGVRIATDHYLRAEGGSTVLRVVSSGFGPDEDWDELYEAWGRGWDFELRGMRHYLEHHRGTPRVVACARVPYRVTHEEMWRRLVGPGGWLGAAGMTNLAEGERYAVRTATGHSLAGVVHNWQPPRQFSGTAEGWNNGLVRIELFDSVATVWLSTYGLAETALAEVQASWRSSLIGAGSASD